MDVRSILRRAANYYAHQPAVLVSGKEYTFEECWRRGLRCHNGLRSIGLLPGDRVGVLDDNTILGVDIYLACAIGNFVRVPLYWRNSVDRHLQMIRKSGCRIVLASGDAPSELARARAENPFLREIVVADGGYESWLADQSEEEGSNQISGDDLCVIKFTGGTTGESKGIPNTHRQWIAIGRDTLSFKPRICTGDTMLHVAPLSHASAYYFLPAWAQGARQIFGSGLESAEIVALMDREKVNHAFMPPTLLNMLANTGNASNCDWGALRTLAIGSAPIGINTLLKAEEVFGRRVLYQTYGTNEAVPIAGMGPDAWFAELNGSEPMKAVGRPLPCADMEIWDEEGNVLPVGEVGEIVAKCDGQMNGYWMDPVETSRKVVNGWIKTGDLGRIDRNGYLYLTDRVGEMVISGGHNIYPGELEKIISGHPDVLEVCVFGVPDKKWGETPIAVCQVKRGSKVTDRDIKSLVTKEIGSYMKPSKVQIILDPLPKSAVGKISRKLMREAYLGASALDVVQEGVAGSAVELDAPRAS